MYDATRVVGCHDVVLQVVVIYVPYLQRNNETTNERIFSVQHLNNMRFFDKISLRFIILFSIISLCQSFSPNLTRKAHTSVLCADLENNDTKTAREQPIGNHLDDEDVIICGELKRELLLLSSVSDRGLLLSKEEKDIIADIVTQLSALNPNSDCASQSYGEWDLVLTSTQAFRSSPFFQSIRSFLNDRDIAENVFLLHGAATSNGKVGRVKQVVNRDGSFVSEVDLEVGVVPGIPFSLRSTVVTTARFEIVGMQQWNLYIQSTRVKKSNVPILGQILDGDQMELAVGDIYNLLTGGIPIVNLQICYVDDTLRITRDVDDNIYVFSRA